MGPAQFPGPQFGGMPMAPGVSGPSAAMTALVGIGPSQPPPLIASAPQAPAPVGAPARHTMDGIHSGSVHVQSVEADERAPTEGGFTAPSSEKRNDGDKRLQDEALKAIQALTNGAPG